MNIVPNVGELGLFFILVLPGLVSMHVYRLVMPASDIDWKTSLLEAFFYGGLNFGLCMPILVPIHLADFPATHGIAYGILMALVLVVMPVAWPILIRLLLNWQPLRKWIVIPLPTAWDFYFHRRRPCIALVHLRNGEMIGGYFGGNSYATSFPRQGDIYLENVVSVDEAGKFVDYVTDSDGVLLTRDVYEYIEFFTAKSE